MNQERRNEIVKLIDGQGTATNTELMRRFDISIETVRRDLAHLEKQGLIERVYGGAVKKKYRKIEPKYDSREQKNLAEKEAIAKEAIKLIESSSAVYFDIGTTVAAVAERVEENLNITAVTNSLRAAIILAEKGIKVAVIGGNLRYDEYALSGNMSQENIKRFNLDVAFISVGGITEDGVNDYTEADADLRRTVIQNAKRVVVLADSSKFGVRTMCNVCGLEEIDILITDEKIPSDLFKRFEKKGVTVIVAK
jgi:DeoR/GlpR family transcriptional regulator of sugar metabolism